VIGLGEAVEKFLHRAGVDLRQDQREGVVGPHLGGSEDGSEGEALVGSARRALAFHVPAMAHADFLPMRASSWKKIRSPLIRTLTDDFPQNVRSSF
jgi:hypothetical protein